MSNGWKRPGRRGGAPLVFLFTLYLYPYVLCSMRCGPEEHRLLVRRKGKKGKGEEYYCSVGRDEKVRFLGGEERKKEVQKGRKKERKKEVCVEGGRKEELWQFKQGVENKAQTRGLVRLNGELGGQGGRERERERERERHREREEKRNGTSIPFHSILPPEESISSHESETRLHKLWRNSDGEYPRLFFSFFFFKFTVSGSQGRKESELPT